MNIIVFGCGKIGATILACLVSEGHNVVVVDRDAAVIEEMTNIYDVMGVCGNGVDREVLMEAGAENADMFVAVTGSDELNMLSCFIVKRMGTKHTIARIRNPEYNERGLSFLRQQLDLSFSINPELLAARELFNILKFPSAVKVEPFSRGNFEMIELRLKADSPLDGMCLSEIRARYQANFLVGVVQRGEEVFIPDGTFVLKSGDRIGLTAAPNEMQKLLRSLGILQKKARSVMILGGSRTAYYLAKMLDGIGTTVKIIEKDESTCQTMCDGLPKAVIIHGDGAHQEILMEEGIQSLDAFVALTGMDEENILISIFAASQSVPKVIAKVNREELGAMAGKLGLECVVSPQKTISDILVRYARALQNSLGSNVETLYHLMDDKAEALEFNVKSDFAQVNVPLKELSLKPNTLIAGIIRNRKTIIPTGEDHIEPEDRVVVLTAGLKLQDLSDILK